MAVVAAGDWRPSAMRIGGCATSVHDDILRGREADVEWEDVFRTADEVGVGVGAVGGGVLDEIEGRLNMDRS